MPDIRYVCLSDMHLGEEDSILTNLKATGSETDPLKPGPVMMQLVECLRGLISKNEDNKKPMLILNGDILELALTNTNQAAMVFERFIELIMPKGGEMFERIMYIPGNHDHHLWELARETQYVNHMKKFKPGEELPIPWHTTNMFVENDPYSLPSYFLTNLVNSFEHLKDFVITTAYPNFGLVSKDQQKCVLFHHGHYIETIYHAMSIFKNLFHEKHKIPENIYDIEAENFAWIDFFWSALGRSGEAGQEIETLYEKMIDREQFKKALSAFADNLNERYNLPGIDWLTVKGLKVLFGYLADMIANRERDYKDRVLSDDTESGLRKYLNVPLKQQILTERKQNIPSEVTFVFGHTHKPFQNDMLFKEYQGWVNVYNTGGWVVDTIEPQPIHGGAMVLIDEDLNAVSLRLYNENADPESYPVKVEEATHAGEGPNPFHKRIAGLVDPTSGPWKRFSRIVARAVYERAQLLRARIHEKS
ncbi:MAG: metallophosphoesterase [Candidatus Brocadia sp.]